VHEAKAQERRNILSEIRKLGTAEHRNYTSRKAAGSLPDKVIGFISWPNPSRRTMVLGSTQPVTEMSTRNLPVGKRRPVRKADLTAICEPIVYKMLEPRRLTTLWTSTACYRDRFTFVATEYGKQNNRDKFWFSSIHCNFWFTCESD
jgi:hypothetical protein